MLEGQLEAPVGPRNVLLCRSTADHPHSSRELTSGGTSDAQCLLLTVFSEWGAEHGMEPQGAQSQRKVQPLAC